MADSSIEAPRARGDFDLGTGMPTTVRSFAEMAHRLTGSTTHLDFGALPYRAGDPMESPPLDVSRLARLGWKARHDIASGIAATIAAEGLR